MLKKIRKILYIYKIKLYTFLYNYRSFRRLTYIFNQELQIYTNLNSDSIFIDIGANNGLHSLYVSDNFNCKIICYEPHPVPFKILKKRFYNIKNVEIYNFAVSDESSYTNLYLHNLTGKDSIDYSDSSSLYKEKFNVDRSKKIEVKTIDIKEILETYKSIDIIKINAEGAEFKILPQIIENYKKIGKVFCELHHDKIPGTNLIYKKIKKSLEEKKLINTWFFENV